MPQMTMVQAIQDALRVALREDSRVVVLGEDVGKNGGVFRVTEGLQAEFGADRVADTPLAENGIVGGAIGMALYGLRPIAEIQFVDFIYPAFDQIVSELAKMRWRSAGQYACPVVVRAPYGGGIRGGLYHSQSPEALFCHTAGLTVVIPSTPYDAKGLLLAALEDGNPVLYLEHKLLYRSARGPVPEGYYTLPIGEARIAREGRHATVVTYGVGVSWALEAAAELADDGRELEVVDLRSLLPWDVAAVVRSVRKTGRCLVLHEAPLTGGYGGELAATVGREAFEWLDAPVARLGALDTPIPFARALEAQFSPKGRLLPALRELLAY